MARMRSRCYSLMLVGLVGVSTAPLNARGKLPVCKTCTHSEHFPAPAHDVLLSNLRTKNPPLPVEFLATAPTLGINISGNTLFLPIMESNVDYLLTSFDVDHLLLPFRQRAGKPAPAGSRPQVGFWDTDLQGANAGRFLMGAGNSLRWVDNAELWEMVNAVVDGVEECKNESNGYILAYPPPGFMHSEQGDYGRSWFTQGMIEVGKAGNTKAFPLLRGLYDWFNDVKQNPYHPYLYDGISNGEQGQIASTRMYLETPVGVYLDSQVAQDTYRDNVWMQQLIARDPTGISAYHMPRPNHPHCYEITAFLSMFDNYRATHNTTWLDAAKGAWDIIHTNFLHIDGTSSLTEGSPDNGTDWKAKSYRVKAGTGTGETCCTTFWIKFNQRFHLRSPTNETYVAQIETAVYNALLRQMVRRPPMTSSSSTSSSSSSSSSSSFSSSASSSASSSSSRSSWLSSPPPPSSSSSSSSSLSSSSSNVVLPPGIRYHAVMEGLQEHGNNDNTCCEGQGTRAIGSLPEYLFSISNAKRTHSSTSAAEGFFVNMFAQSSFMFNASVAQGRGYLPKPAAPPDPPVLPPPPPPQSLAFVEIINGAYYGGAYDQSQATSLDECKSNCLSTQHPNMCMGLTWVGGDAPSPLPPQPLCHSDCTLVEVPNGLFYHGEFNVSQFSSVKSLDSCEAVCLRDDACVQLTWVERPTDPCVLYQTIYNTTWIIAGVSGFVKCNHGATDPTCAPFSPPPPPGPAPTTRCALYRAIDTTRPPTNLTNVTQLMVTGRRNTVQHDWVTPTTQETSSDDDRVPDINVKSSINVKSNINAKSNINDDNDNGTVAIVFAVTTAFPMQNDVSMIVKWEDSNVSSVSMKLQLRIPSWLIQQLSIDVVGTEHIGTPGTYLPIDRIWANGDTIKFSFPVVFKLSLYTGFDQVVGYEGKRYAVSVGPVVLALVGPMDKECNGAICGTTVLPIPPTNAETWLVPTNQPLHYTINGTTTDWVFKPMWDIQNNETFSIYPIFDPTIQLSLSS